MAQTAATSQSMANSIVSSMTSMAGKIYAVYQSFQLVVGEIKAIVDASLRMESMANAMNAITGSGTLAKDSMEFVSQTANKLGLNLVSLEDAYKNLAGSAMGTSLAGKETEKIFMAVSKASAVLGLSAEQTQGSLYAIGQMMSKGTVQAEELKGQLAERLPGAFQMAAKAMGVTTAELQKMLEKGEVLAVDLIPKLANELENRFASGAREAGESARAAFENFGNAVENLRRALESSGIIEFLAEMAERATAVMNSITKLINGPTSDDKIQSNMKRLIELRKEEEKASQSEISAAKERQRISMANSFGGGRSPLPSSLSAGQTVRQKEIEILKQEQKEYRRKQK
jgi:tape measure domain-containing protein